MGVVTHDRSDIPEPRPRRGATADLTAIIGRGPMEACRAPLIDNSARKRANRTRQRAEVPIKARGRPLATHESPDSRAQFARLADGRVCACGLVARAGAAHDRVEA
jgi:hypothetical protein